MTPDLKQKLEDIFDSYYGEKDRIRSKAVIEDAIKAVKNYLIQIIK